MHKIIALLLIILTTISCAHYKAYSHSANVQRIAVIVLPHKKMPIAQVQSVAMEVLADKGYIVSSRSDFDRVLKEQKIQSNQLTEKRPFALVKS